MTSNNATQNMQSAIFERCAMRNKTSSADIPFCKTAQGDFIYLTNRIAPRYSYLYESLDDGEVFNNCSFHMGYTALFICEKIAFSGTEGDNFTEMQPITYSPSPFASELTGLYCILQNPLAKLSSHGHNDILKICRDIETATRAFEDYALQTSVLLARIKFQMDWH